MVAHCDFVEQSTIHTEDGRLRPDMLVRLPGGKLIVVDSKVPLDAYLAAIEAPRRTPRERHSPATPGRRAITSPSSPRRATSEQFDSTPELVVMFVPSDGIYQAALAAGPGADRVRRRTAGADGHADDADRAAAGRALRLGPGADRRVGARDRRVRARAAPPAWAFAEHLAKIGRQLDSAVSAYNKAVGSFDRKRDPADARGSSGGRRLRARDRGAAGDRADRAPGHRAAGARRGAARRSRGRLRAGRDGRAIRSRPQAEPEPRRGRPSRSPHHAIQGLGSSARLPEPRAVRDGPRPARA